MEEITFVEKFLIIIATLATVHGFVSLMTDLANSIQGALYLQKHPEPDEDEEDPAEYELVLSVWDYIPFMIGASFLLINYLFSK